MPTYRLTVAYDGTDFAGWQRQDNGPSIQAALETALAALFGHPVACQAAGRTDAGVHASGQVVSFTSPRTLPSRAIVYGTNDHLPTTIAVMAAEAVADDFEARHSASGKLYRYQVYNGPVRSPLHARTHWHVYNGRTLDLPAMQAAAATLVGRHDFAGFRAASCERKTTVRTIRRLEVFRPADRYPGSGADAAEISIEVEATAFLRNMVRILAGTLVHVGRGKMTPEQVAQLLTSRDRTKGGPTAPPQGLTLCRVDYGPRDAL